MRPTRRDVLAGLATVALLPACRERERAGGEVGGGDVVAAGQPAAILLLALAPERLAGWPRRPSPAALRQLGPAADKPELGALTSGGRPASLEVVAARRPALVIDYGDRTPAYEALTARIERRLGAPTHLLDGALARTPAALREAGRLLGLAPRAERLADIAARTLDGWRAAARGTLSFYLARDGDGLETGFAGSLATEVLEGAGWRNVAAGGTGIGRVGRERVAAWDPEALVTLDARFAARAAGDPLWSRRRDGRPRRILLLPDLPFGWIDRPPSLNRLLGCAWLADPAGAGAARAGELARLFWGAQGPTGAPRWIA